MSKTWQDVDKLAGECYKAGKYDNKFDIPNLEPVTACTYDGKLLNYPYTHKEWEEYSENLLNEFDQIYRNEKLPVWNNLKFRLETDFKAGIFGGFPKIWLIFKLYISRNYRHSQTHNLLPNQKILIICDFRVIFVRLCRSQNQTFPI